jgi:putative ubiquitin-RnfH superfamily antitoxin RatB of RatAB toxin-antitoxin module
MAPEPDLAVEVVYALPDQVIAASARVEPGTTVGEVIERVEFARLVPDVALDDARVGIFGRIVSRETPVRDGDRIEIYRPLFSDPKQARRQRSSRKVRSGT